MEGYYHAALFHLLGVRYNFSLPYNILPLHWPSFNEYYYYSSNIFLFYTGFLLKSMAFI